MSNPLRFSLRRLFWVITWTAVLLGLALGAWGKINGNREELAAGFAKDKRIVLYDMSTEQDGIGDVTCEVIYVTIGIKNKPGSRIVISMPEEDIFSSEADHISLAQLGDLILSEQVTYQDGTQSWGHVDVGTNSILSNVLPFAVRNLNELIERYDELYAGFKKWPSPDRPGRLTLTIPGGPDFKDMRIEYWAEPASEVFGK